MPTGRGLSFYAFGLSQSRITFSLLIELPFFYTAATERFTQRGAARDQAASNSSAVGSPMMRRNSQRVDHGPGVLHREGRAMNAEQSGPLLVGCRIGELEGKVAVPEAMIETYRPLHFCRKAWSVP
jgi:hypothetical protein